MHVAAIAVGLAAAAVADWRWLLVAQREHYLPGSATRFALRWWRIGPNRILGAAAVVGVALSPLTPAVALVAALAIAVGPFGFPLRPRAPGRLAWTTRLRTVAATVGAAEALIAAAAIVLGAGAPVAAALALVAPLSVDAVLAALKPVEDHRAAAFVNQARTRLDAVRPAVVAITGSYGKTTTKMFAAHLIAPARRVVPSPRSFNNRAGLSRAVNEHLTPGTEVFIAEMGTYGRGEIADLVGWLRPEVSAITAIGPVHLERFGTEDEIVRAKAEIFSGARTAVLNVDNARLAALADELHDRHERSDLPELQVVRCSARDPAADVAAVNEGGRLVLRRAGEVVGDSALPDAPLENIAVAAALAFAVGVPAAAVASALATLPAVPNRQALERLSTGAVAVDDTFNSNPAGTRAALATLCRHATDGAKRVVVTPGMVELGPVQYDENRAWGERAARAATHLIVVGLTNRRALLAGAATVPPDERAQLVVVHGHEQAVAWVRAHTTSGDVVLYENQLPDHYP